MRKTQNSIQLLCFILETIGGWLCALLSLPYAHAAFSYYFERYFLWIKFRMRNIFKSSCENLQHLHFMLHACRYHCMTLFFTWHAF